MMEEHKTLHACVEAHEILGSPFVKMPLLVMLVESKENGKTIVFGTSAVSGITKRLMYAIHCFEVSIAELCKVLHLKFYFSRRYRQVRIRVLISFFLSSGAYANQKTRESYYLNQSWGKTNSCLFQRITVTIRSQVMLLTALDRKRLKNPKPILNITIFKIVCSDKIFITIWIWRTWTNRITFQIEIPVIIPCEGDRKLIGRCAADREPRSNSGLVRCILVRASNPHFPLQLRV